MCQTTAPLTKKSSHLLWNAFSQWLPLGLASVEVKVWCLITFGRAIFCSSFQLRKPEKENAISPSSPWRPRRVFFFFLSSVFLCVQTLFCSFFFFLLDLLKHNLMCSSAGFDTGAAFWRSKVIQSFLQFERLWNGFWSIVRHLSFSSEKLPTENEILQGRTSRLICTISLPVRVIPRTS